MEPKASPLIHPLSDLDMGGVAYSQAKLPGTLARQDLLDGFRQWWMWTAMAWQDILQRYRGSALGPFWLTLSMLVTIVALGLLYSKLFKMDIESYLPFLCLGMISWTLISSIILDGCNSLIAAENIIKQIKVPFSVHAYRVLWRNLIIAAHNIIVYVGVMMIFDIGVSLKTLLVIPGLVLVIVNGAWSVLLVGMICARFRDVPQIMASLIQVVFFVSPIIWRPELLGEHVWMAHLNPFFAFIDVLREPLLNHTPAPISWMVALGVTVAGWAVTFLFFSRFRSRIPYWV
jgi:lipopolysaccharide transport system permease protein